MCLYNPKLQIPQVYHNFIEILELTQVSSFSYTYKKFKKKKKEKKWLNPKTLAPTSITSRTIFFVASLHDLETSGLLFL